MLELKKRTLALKFENKECLLRIPTALELEKFGNESKKDPSLKFTLDFLTELGLPKEIGAQLDYEHLTQILEGLTPVKKK